MTAQYVNKSEPAAPSRSSGSVPITGAKDYRRQIRRANLRTTALVVGTRILLIVVFLRLWEWGAASGRLDPFFFGQPSEIWNTLMEEVQSGQLINDSLATFGSTAIGWLVGAAAGILAGFLLSLSQFLDRVISPLLVALNSTPRVAIAPLFILWFGIGPESKIWLAVSIVFFIVVANTDTGLKAADREYLTLVRAHGGSSLQQFVKVKLPGALPSIFGGLKLGVIYALLAVIFGEMLASREGLGQTIITYQNAFNVNGILAIVALLIVVGTALHFALDAAERRLIRWS